MTPTDQFISGLNQVIALKEVTRTQACKNAGIDPMTLRRFLTRKTNIKLDTLTSICEDGFGVSFDKVYHLGGK